MSSGKKSLPAPIRIEISGHYKSIDDIVWDNVPAFVVLTGLNGSGKTQLLEVLSCALTGTQRDGFASSVAIVGDTFTAESVAYIPSNWSMSSPSLGPFQLQQAKQQLLQSLRGAAPSSDRTLRAKRARIERSLGVKRLEDLLSGASTDSLPDDFVFMLDEIDVTAGLVYVFVAYRLRAAEAHEEGMSDDAIAEKLGPAPWDVLNQTFDVAGFPFRVVSPVGNTKLMDEYQLRFEDVHRGYRLRDSDLSSGEKTMLGLVLWLYNSNEHGLFPKLLLMDEPDAHLHPSLTRQFLAVVEEVLVRRYGVRIILTTHSPSTVALAPEESIYEMSRSKPRIARSASKAATVALLTEGLVIVSPGMRFVLVEDADDVEFYTMVRDVLTDHSQTRDPGAMKAAPTVTFLPASLGTGKMKIAGGKSVVTQWLEKLDSPPLGELFRGIIDRDSGNKSTSRMEVLGRYSIENYYVDPLVVFTVTLDEGNAPTGLFTIPRGQEHVLRTLRASDLQQIVDAVTTAATPGLGHLTPNDTAKVEVVLTNGRVLEYPAWTIERNGHELLIVYQKAFGGPKVISKPRLLRAFRRARLIPVELADIMARLQS